MGQSDRSREFDSASFHFLGSCEDNWGPLILENEGTCRLDYIRFESDSDSNAYGLMFMDSKKNKLRHACWHEGDEIYLNSWKIKPDRFILVQGASHSINGLDVSEALGDIC